MEMFDKTDLNRVRRLPARGQYDRATIDAIVDEALICHVAFAEAGQPFVIPTIHARMGDEIVLHGAPASRLLKHIVAAVSAQPGSAQETGSPGQPPGRCGQS